MLWILPVYPKSDSFKCVRFNKESNRDSNKKDELQ
jgi:hypothetical protein